jgi:hypothetical protein
MPDSSLVDKIRRSGKPFTLFHTWTVSDVLLQQAIDDHKSMDLDVCVDDNGNPYLGHSREYHEKSGDPYFNSLPIWEVVDRITRTDIIAMIDCKHFNAWPVIERIVERIGPEKCIVGGFVSEFKFAQSRGDNEPDYLSEWSPVERLRLLKGKYPAVTTTACVKWPPVDLLTGNKYQRLIEYIVAVIKDNNVNTVCLGVPDKTITDHWLHYFGNENIIPHIMIDNVDTRGISGVYIGETDHLERVSVSSSI